MYPNYYFGLFPPFPREDKVFVAMSFDPQFRSRWERVIEPAVRGVSVGGRSLEPHRVDARMISDSILADILGGISNDRVVIADVTKMGSINGRAVRNGNVMYEVGLAHAIRLPEEVLLFRSDSDDLPFDIANVKVNRYDPDNDPDNTRRRVGEAIVEAIKGIDLKRHLAVRSAVQTLDVTSRFVLLRACLDGSMRDFPTRTLEQLLGNGPTNGSIRQLLEIGALAANGHLDPESIRDLNEVRDLLKYVPTKLGYSMCEYIKEEMCGDVKVRRELMNALKARIEDKD